MERESFLFRKEWCDAVSGLSPKLRLQVYEGIINYALHGEPFEPTGQVTRLAFINARPVIDRDNEELAKREIALQKCREAGKRGGRPKKNSQKPTEKGGFLEGFSTESQSPSHAHVIGDNNNLNNNQDIKDKKKEEKKESEEKEKKKQSQLKATLPDRKAEFEKSLEPFIPVYGKAMIDKFFSYWSESNPSRTKMKKELQKTWETPRRLRTWASRENIYNTQGSNYKTQNNGNQQQQIDPRRGTPARQHTLEEFLAKD